MKQSVSTVETDIEIRNSSFKSVQKETKKIVNSPIYTAERLASLKEDLPRLYSFSLAYNKACSLSEIPGNFGLAIIVLAFGIIQIYGFSFKEASLSAV